jgi:hypothetical protein
MPNWCSGVLKVRGKKKDILNFLNNGIERIGYPRDKDDNYTKYPLNAQLDEYGDVFCKETDEEHHSWLYFKDSRRLFIEKNIEWYFNYGIEDDEEEIQALDIKQAWNLEPDYFIDISKKYNVDFKMMGFECGGCFTQEIEVVKGNLVLNKVNEYKENYWWEVYDPRLGG